MHGVAVCSCNDEAGQVLERALGLTKEAFLLPKSGGQPLGCCSQLHKQWVLLKLASYHGSVQWVHVRINSNCVSRVLLDLEKQRPTGTLQVSNNILADHPQDGQTDCLNSAGWYAKRALQQCSTRAANTLRSEYGGPAANTAWILSAGKLKRMSCLALAKFSTPRFNILIEKA